MYVIDIWAKEGRGGFVLKRAVYTPPSNFPAIFLNGVQKDLSKWKMFHICIMIKWKPYIAFLNNTQEVWAASSSGEKNQRGTLHMISWSVPLYVLLADDLAEFKSWFKDDCLTRVNPLLWKRQSCFWPGALVSMKRWNMLNVRQLDIWWLVAQPEVKIYFQCWCNNMFFI